MAGKIGRPSSIYGHVTSRFQSNWRSPNTTFIQMNLNHKVYPRKAKLTQSQIVNLSN